MEPISISKSFEIDNSYNRAYTYGIYYLLNITSYNRLDLISSHILKTNKYAVYKSNWNK